jgi:hypothetical protein
MAGTHRENQHDKAARGRSCRGEKQHNSKLTEELVVQARTEYRLGQDGFEKLSKKYGISKIAMQWAITGKTWSYVPGSVPAKKYHKEKSTFCKRGHLLTEETCYIYGRIRQCKKCTTIRAKRKP